MAININSRFKMYIDNLKYKNWQAEQIYEGWKGLKADIKRFGWNCKPDQSDSFYDSDPVYSKLSAFASLDRWGRYKNDLEWTDWEEYFERRDRCYLFAMCQIKTLKERKMTRQQYEEIRRRRMRDILWMAVCWDIPKNLDFEEMGLRRQAWLGPSLELRYGEWRL